MRDGARPFLRWVGGKARIIERLRPFVPSIDGATYFEPFLGAGSLYFRLGPRRAVLGDQNRDLVDCFTRVAERPDLVWRHLRVLMQQQSREEYTTLRAEFNSTEASNRRAALFIYLNKTSFNGIWRVSRTGKYNVPFGGKPKPGFPDGRQLRLCADALATAQLLHGDFEKTLVTASQGDFVYLDPPYLPLSATSFFNHYTLGRFDTADHERVAEAAANLASNNVRVMITEGDSPLVRKWYSDFVINEIAVRRFVSSGSDKVLAKELVITSYLPPADEFARR
ncbi:MAG: adenine methylase [Ilumatobacteraceae bacterium]|nr:adenine methylase [Ilumatobacteraceae bacterium]